MPWKSMDTMLESVGEAARRSGWRLCVCLLLEEKPIILVDLGVRQSCLKPKTNAVTVIFTQAS